MTKELSAKRKVDKCRDTHPRARGAEGVSRAPMRGWRRTGERAHWPESRGARPAPSSRFALIELGLSFDFEWGERAVLRAGKNYPPNSIPSVIDIIRYSRGSSNYVAVSLRAAPLQTSRTRPARRGASAAVHTHCFDIASRSSMSMWGLTR